LLTVLTDLLKRDFVFFDNGNGWIMLKRGLKPGQRPDIMNMTAPDIVEEIQRESCLAGSDIVCANTFGANRKALAGTGYDVGDVIKAAVAITKRACAGRALTAYDIGPIGEFIRPFGPLTFEESYELYKEQVIAAEAAGADLFAAETMSDLMEVKAVLLAVRENTKLPVFATMTFDKSGRSFTGCRPESFAVTAERLGAAAVGINCSLAPSEIYAIAGKLAAATSLPVIIKPNAGMPDSATGAYSIGPEDFARQMAPYAELGVKIVGGCCGTSPDYIRALRRTYASLRPGTIKRETGKMVCTPLQIERLDGYTYQIPGHYGKRTPGEVIEDALEQADRGEKILCVYLPEGLTPEDAGTVVRGIQGQSDRPLHLVSGDPAVLDTALRNVAGIAAVSCTGGADIDTVAAKYGAVVL
jgi:5-methyltetrahydrofolate--homocysteine methyltransferase